MVSDRDSSARYQAGVLGHPIAHSQSPLLHSTAYRQLELPIGYDRYDVVPEELASFLEEAKSSEETWLGFSVTMPLKGAAVELMDSVSTRVNRLGFLNTIVFDEQGKASGYNTDVDGIVEALTFAGLSQAATGGRMAILGAGGTAAASIEAACLLEMDGVDIFARQLSKAEPQVLLAQHLGLNTEVHNLDTFSDRAGQYQAVISTLPPRAADGYAEQLGSQHDVGPLLDVAYDPWPSRLATSWHNAGGRVVSGLEMLLYQAVEQVKLFSQGLSSHDLSEGDWQSMTARMAHEMGLAERS